MAASGRAVREGKGAAAPGRPRPVIGAATLPGDHLADPGAITVEDAIARGVEMCWPVSGQEKLRLRAAYGRVLFYAVKARHPLPAHDCASVDGYALRLADLAGDGPWQLPVAARQPAGHAPPRSWPEGSVIEIATGAVIPKGCNAVVMREDVSRHDDQVTIPARPEEQANIRHAGEDISPGTVLAQAGRLIDPRTVAVLAAAGQAQVTVRRRVLVALLGIGSELREPGERLGPGQIWDANRLHLTGALEAPWIEVLDLGNVAAAPDQLASALERAAYGADLVVTTGGIATGHDSPLYAALSLLGAEAQPLRLALRRTKPLLLARLGKTVHLGLPGNPVPAFIAWHVIGARLLEALAGLVPTAGHDEATGPRRIAVRADFALTRPPGPGEFLPARLGPHDSSGVPTAIAIAPDLAHRLGLLAEAEGLLRIPAETTQITPGDLLEFLPF